MITVEINNDQLEVPLDQQRLREAVQLILKDASVRQANVSIAVVDDPTIHALHRQYLELDEPTDVLSFILERSEDCLEGEVIVSAETAELTAGWYGWPAEDELLLYVIHGTLHLVGYDDTTPETQAEMRKQELACLACFGVEGRYHAQDVAPDDSAPGGKEIP